MKKWRSVVAQPPSPPMWGCGLKLSILPMQSIVFRVTPYVGVWIEISDLLSCLGRTKVTPYVGVWIEINSIQRKLGMNTVTPYVGVWIEI